MHEKLSSNQIGDIYEETVQQLNGYFTQACYVVKERMKFREMQMKEAEPFSDWVLRLETQAKFCNFGVQQREEEFLQALLRRSVTEISEKLCEMSNIFNNILERIIHHGKHLDYIRLEAQEMNKTFQSHNER